MSCRLCNRYGYLNDRIQSCNALRIEVSLCVEGEPVLAVLERFQLRKQLLYAPLFIGHLCAHPVPSFAGLPLHRDLHAGCRASA